MNKLTLNHLSLVFLALLVSLVGGPLQPLQAEGRDSSPPVYYLDFSARSSELGDDPAAITAYYDDIMALTAIQGLANRDEPNLFIRHLPETDDFWWDEMTKPGDWLDGREIKKVSSLDQLLDAFPKAYQGLVVWDGNVPATSNVALSLAGVENLLPVRFDAAPDSLFTRLSARGLEPKVWLVNQDGTPLFTGTGNIPSTATASSGSSKNDAYRWLLHHYGDKLDPERISYHLDSFWTKCSFASAVVENAVPNADYFIAHGAIRCDLHVMADEAPVDDPGQKPGTDLETLKLILANANKRLAPDRMIQFAGFTPWAHKYSSQVMNGWNPGSRYAPLTSEQRLVQIITSFNAYMDGDAPNLVFMANASFYQHFPVPAVVAQKAPKPTRERLIQEGILDENGKIKPLNFYTYYTGDYDAAPWLLRMVPRLWNDPARGQVPISWAFNPNLADRFAYGMMWLRNRATPNDFFVSGDSGAGYVNPSLLQAPRQLSGLPDGMKRWTDHNSRYFKRWDLDVVGFIIDGTAPAMNDDGWDAYREFSPGGVVVQGMDKPFGIHQELPYIVMGPNMLDVTDPKLPAGIFRSYFRPEGFTFTTMRTILVQAPTLYKQVDEILQAQTDRPSRLVDLATLLWLIREYSSHPDDYPPVPHFNNAQEVFTDATVSHGLTVRMGGEDGLFEEVKAGPDNTGAWKVNGPYLYLDVDNEFARSLNGPVTMDVTYLDQGSGELALEFDGGASPYQVAQGAATLENTGTWKTARFSLTDPKFSSRQNGGMDLRINRKTNESVIIRDVKIQRQAP